MDSIDAMCTDGHGTLYICDSRLKRIYKWNEKSGKIELLLSTTDHYL